MKLYGYWRSSSSWRVRIALAYKELEWTDVPVSLIKDGGEQHHEPYRQINGLAQVPSLELAPDVILTQSMAILEYLEEGDPAPALLPQDLLERAKARQYAEIINSGIQPLQNLSVLKKLAQEGHPNTRKWGREAIVKGLDTLNDLLSQNSQGFLVGSQPTFADICLIPQLYNAQRFNCQLTRWPRLLSAWEAAFELEAFLSTRPEMQIDAQIKAA
jgi:maleylpyruvate isomerase